MTKDREFTVKRTRWEVPIEDVLKHSLKRGYDFAISPTSIQIMRKEGVDGVIHKVPLDLDRVFDFISKNSELTFSVPKKYLKD